MKLLEDLAQHKLTKLVCKHNGALDVAKNMVMSSTGQAITWDENGLRLRKWNEAHTGYEDQQIWMTHGTICFTDNGWRTAKMAIGHVVDPAFADPNNPDKTGDLWGIVAENLVGKMIAGENLYIYGADGQGRNATFTIDGTGVHSTNMSQIWDSGSGQVAVAPEYGIIAGVKGANGQGLFEIVDGKIVPAGALSVADGKPTNDNINVWIGTDGTAYFKGTIYAKDGYFKGDIHADSGEFAGTIHASRLDGEITGLTGGKIKGVSLDIGNGKFTVDKSGNTYIEDGEFHAPEIYGGKIYAKNNSSNYAEMTNSGFTLWNGNGWLANISGVDDNMNYGGHNCAITSQRRIILYTPLNDGVYIVNGVGGTMSRVLTESDHIHYTLA